jgi:hypothetical protein
MPHFNGECGINHVIREDGVEGWSGRMGLLPGTISSGKNMEGGQDE